MNLASLDNRPIKWSIHIPNIEKKKAAFINKLTYNGLISHYVTTQKWGLTACHHQKENSSGRYWWDGKTEFIWMLNNLEKWRPPCLKAYLLCKTQKKPSSPQQDQNKRKYPEYLLHFKNVILGNLRQLFIGHLGSLACSQMLSGFRLPPGGCMWIWCHQWSCDFLGHKVLYS